MVYINKLIVYLCHMNSDILTKILDGRKQIYLAEKLGVEPMTVSKWGKNGVPAERVVEVERVSGVHRHVIRPDLYDGYIRVAS